jgi:phosphoribosylformylglycinamidine synthase subunit PurQ / glutaminase
MAKQVKALIITGYGTNCEIEMAYACTHAGATAEIAHLSDILGGKISIEDYQFLNLPGGFLDGDDLGSAQVESVRLKHARIRGTDCTIYEEILRFFERGGLILGVCNGFQALVKTGLLPGNPFGKRRVTLTFNDSARFEDRWVALKVNPLSPCVFTKGLDIIHLPVRHGEGKFIADNDRTLEDILTNNLSALFYIDRDGHPTQIYPANPNGSVHAIAGICDTSGRIFGLMPHPEAYTHPTNHPLWTRRKDLPDRGDGMEIFDNAVAYLRGIQ